MTGVVSIGLAQMRGEPSHRAELVNQLLFGECFRTLETKNDWSFVEATHDGYRGWIYGDFQILTRDSTQEYILLVQKSVVAQNGSESVCLSVGARIPVGGVYRGERYLFSIDQTNFSVPFKALARPRPFTRETLCEAALLFEGLPYLWGGRSTFGIDCSGLTQMAFNLCGKKLPRDAYQQAEGGTLRDFETRAAGDLAFFSAVDSLENDRVTHVGLLLSKDLILHAAGSGTVRRDAFNISGIERSGKLTHRLHSIKTF